MGAPAGRGATATDAPGATEVATDEATAQRPATASPWWRRVGRVDRLLAAAVVLGAVVRVWGIGAQSLWYDEWLTAEAASGSLSNLGRYVTRQAGIPPAYFAVMWGWVRVFGDSDAALRALSALAGVATIPVAYAAARELGQRRAVARVAAVLVAVHPMLVWYSQEARPYSLLALLGALSLLTLARVWNRGGQRELMAWALVCAVAIAVHYFAVFLVAAEAMFLLVVRRPSRRDLLEAGWPAGVLLALLAPFAVAQFSRRSNHDWITDYPLVGRLRNAGRDALVGPTPYHDRLWQVIAVVAALAVVLVVVRGDRDQRRAAAVAGGLGAASILLALAANVVGVDVIIERYLIASLVLFVVAVAVGLGATRAPRPVAWAAGAVFCVTSLAIVAADAREPALQRADWRAVADAHEAAEADGPRLLVLNLHGHLGRPLLWYLDGARVLRSGESVSVEQIDVVVSLPTTKPCNGFVGMECSLVFLGAPPPEPLAGELELTERIELDQFALDRYRAARPLTVTQADVVNAYDRQRQRTLLIVTGEE